MLQAAIYTDLLAYQIPGIKILEIGGGTASATRGLIYALSSDPFGNAGRTLRYKRYDFTDVSSAFLKNARESFVPYHDQMTFGILNIEQDFATQGYGEGEYDLVVADGVLHITADLNQTLTNVRKALKPGGKLIMPELLKCDGWTAGFVFGVFPGWWLGSVEDHPLSPNLSADDWGAILKSNGFTGSEMVLTDFDGPAHHLGCIISTALAKSPSSSVSRQRPNFSSTIIVDKKSIEQMQLADHLLPKLSEAFGKQSNVLTLEEAVCFDRRNPADFNILLLDYASFFFSSLDEFEWVRFQTLVESARHILWISSGGGKTPLPAHGMIDGLARTLRLEYYELHLVTMALDPRSGYGEHVSHLAQIVDEMLHRTALECYEQEYVEMEGRLHMRRLIEADYLKSDMEAQLMPYKIVSKPLGQVRFQSSTEGLAGLEVESFFVECNSTPTPLENDDVDILVRAVPLQDQNRSRDTIHYYGNACAGVVASAGPRSALRPEDRVFAIASSSLRSEMRVSSQKVVILPENVSYSEAASLLPNLLIAYQALIEIGQTCQDGTIFVHDGYSALGCAAIDLLTKRGKYSIWTTADNEEQSTWIVRNLNIPSENVIPSGWFDSEPMLVSHLKRTFDVVISSQDEFETPFLIDCIGMGALYLKIQQAGGPSTSNRQAVSLLPISMSIIRSTSHVPTSEALQYASAQIKTSLLQLSEDQVSVFPASELTSAFHHLRYTTSGTTVVIELNDSDVISVRMSKDDNYRLRPDATYIIAGSLGGLGRAMARWLASHGARYLILLSRSGMRTAEAHELSIMLREQGVHCEMPACSVADRHSLRSVLLDCATRMPPIRGCIQSSMIMTEKIFQQMSFADWEETLKAKVDGSWNLHEELPHDLDFFMLISSMMGIMGIMGSGSLAAYNAGNTYQDTLAHYRVSIGQRAVSLNLGAVPDGGYLFSNADHVAARQHVLQAEKYALTHVQDLCALLHMFCRPERGLSSHDIGCQAVVGIRPPSHWKHVEEVPLVFGQPFWGHMHHMPLPPDLSDTVLLSQNSAKKPARDVENLVAAGSLTEAAAIVSEALAQRISSLLGVTEDRLDTQKLMHSYGLDSLSSIEIRNWIGQAFNVDLPVFMILGGATFSSAAETIVSKI